MTRQQIFDYVNTIEGAAYDYPWEGDFTDCVLRHKASKKWFGLFFPQRAKAF